MLWFKYKWLMIFSHGLCVKIIRGGQAIKALSVDIKKRFNDPMNGKNVGVILNRIELIIINIEGIIFSASALLYREEKSLLQFTKKVDLAVQHLVKRCGKDKKRFNKDSNRLQEKMEEFNKHKKKLPKKLQGAVRHEKGVVSQDLKAQEKAVLVLEQLVELIKSIEAKIYHTRLEAKAQERETFNFHKVKETIIIRSNYRLGELIGREGGIEAGLLDKRAHAFMERAHGKFKNLSKGGEYAEHLLADMNSEIHQLVGDSKMEAKDASDAIHFSILVMQRVKEYMGHIRHVIISDNLLKRYLGELNRIAESFEELKGEIFTQVKRLDNEFGIKNIPKKGLRALKS